MCAGSGDCSSDGIICVLSALAIKCSKSLVGATGALSLSEHEVEDKLDVPDADDALGDGRTLGSVRTLERLAPLRRFAGGASLAGVAWRRLRSNEGGAGGVDEMVRALVLTCSSSMKF